MPNQNINDKSSSEGRVFFKSLTTGNTVHEEKFVEPYLPVPNALSVPNDELLPLTMTIENNIIVYKNCSAGEIPWRESFQVIEHLDMDTTFNEIGNGRKINTNKFGTYWLLLSHFQMCKTYEEMESYFSGYK